VAALQGGALVVHFTNRKKRHFSFPPDSGHERAARPSLHSPKSNKLTFGIDLV
jgi:hypothetical protein